MEVRYSDDIESGVLSVGTSTERAGNRNPTKISIDFSGRGAGHIELGPHMAHELMIQLEDIFRAGSRAPH